MSTANDRGSAYNNVCAVSIKLPEGKSFLEGTASGILIDSRLGLVLTHASVLYPLVENCHAFRLERLLKDGSGDRRIFYSSSEDVEVILPNHNCLGDTGLTNDRTIHPVQLLSTTVQNERSFFLCKGKLSTIFECKSLKNIILKLMPSESWQFIEDATSEEGRKTEQNKVNNKAELCYNLLPFFVLIKLQNFCSVENVLSVGDSIDNKVGEPVEICATPFGSMSPEVFLNARSRGILSKVAGPRGVLLMTDARCVPGSEGGALLSYHRRKRLLIGIMVASLCWKNNEWVGLSLACAISEVLGSLQSHLTFDFDRINRTKYIHEYDQSLISKLIKTVRCVKVGYNWGSGVLIDSKKKLIITCSHVLKDANWSTVSVSHSDAKTSDLCNIIYRTPKKSQFDIAFIQVKGASILPEFVGNLAFGRAVEGEIVYVIGHAIFRHGVNMSPMVCRGIVSKIVRHNNVPVMLQTTCAVHAGASGGGVFNTHGQLIGMVVCNSKDKVSGASYPHVNMCVPIETVASVIRYYIKTNDVDILKSLHVRSGVVKRIWSIGSEDNTGVSHL